MRKKPILKAVCVLFILLGISYGVFKHNQTRISVYDFGTLEVPNSWTQIQSKDFLIFCDKTGQPTMVEFYYTDVTDYSNGSGTIRTIVDGVETCGTIRMKRSTLYSNSAQYGIVQINVGGEVKDVPFIQVYATINRVDYSAYFYCANNLSGLLLRQIAKSFRHN